MTYRSTPFPEVLGGVMRLAGLGAVAAADDDARAQACEFINQRLREAWEQEFWAELCPAELRYYRPAWSPIPTYEAGTELWYGEESDDVIVVVAASTEVNGAYFLANDGSYYLNNDAESYSLSPAPGGMWQIYSPDGEICYYEMTGTLPIGSNWTAVDGVGALTVSTAGKAVKGYYRATPLYGAGTIEAGQSPASLPDSWTLITSMRRYVALDQPDETPIGEVYALYDRDPVEHPTAARRIRHLMTDQGIVPQNWTENVVWVRFRLRPLVFTLMAYAAGTAYAAGAVVLFSTDGECYRALVATTGNAPTSAAHWEKLLFPYVLASFVKRAAYADMLPADGESNASERELGKAYRFLSDASDTATLSQGQSERARVQTY